MPASVASEVQEVYSEDSDYGYSKKRIKSSVKFRGSMKKGAGTPKRPGSGSPRSRPTSGRASTDLWLSSLNKTAGPSPRPRKGHVGKRTSVEYWTDTLRKSGVGISTESSGMNSLSGLNKTQGKNMAYSSTSHYLRQVAGTEKPKKGTVDITGKAAPGTPAYKSQEEYYEEILVLKKEIQGMKSENSTMKSKIRRLEEDNLKKEKEMQQLLDPSKNDEMRRTLTDRKPDTGTVIHSLKQKILKLEHQIKDKEAAYTKLQSDLKTTKVDELKTQLDVFHQEIIRLHQAKTVGLETQKLTKTAPVKESPAKLKALQETILRMNEKNVRLQTENKTLKQDLEKLMDDAAHTKNTHKEYESMNKKQLLAAITKLEKRLNRADADAYSLASEVEYTKTGDVQGKISLEGNVNQKLDQLDKRETELLEEVQKLKSQIKRLKDDRVHYRKKYEQKEKEVKALKREIEDLRADMENAGVTPRPTPRKRPPSGRRSPGSVSGSRRSRSPTGHQTSDRELEREKERRVEEFVQNRAAKNIQKNWRSHRSGEEEEAAEFLQSALRGHLTRRQQMKRIQSPSRGEGFHRGRRDSRDEGFHRGRGDSEATESDLENAAEYLQTAFRGHMNRKEINKRGRSSPRSRSPRSFSGGRRNTHSLLDSEGEEQESDSMLSSRRGSGRQKRPSLGRLSLTTEPGRKPRPSSPKRHSRTMVASDDDSDIAGMRKGRFF